MKSKYNPETPHADADLNSAPAFAGAIKAVVKQAALDGPSMPGPCTWLRKPGNADPPKEVKEEPATRSQLEPAQKIPLQMQVSAEPITDSNGNGKQVPAALEFLRGLLLSKSFIDVVADAAVEKLLAEQAQSAEAIDSSASVECEVASYLYFVEEPGGPIAYAHYDSDPRYCRALRVALNLGNRKTIAYLEKGEARTVAFFCARAVARLVLRQQQTPFEAAILATLLTTIGRAPNARITEERFAVGLAQSVLLARLPDLPIYNNTRLVAGRSFYLGKSKVFTPREDLGEAWKDHNKPRT
jgi:hypothetical protein